MVRVKLVRTRRSRPRRVRARNRNNQTNNASVTTRALVPVAPIVQRTFKPPRNRRVNQRARLTEPGMAFLKCAFASPDFSVDPGKGIPDTHEGRVLAIKDSATAAIDFTAGTDTYIVVAPVPGYAYFTGSAAIGSVPTNLTGVPYSTYTTNFGTSGGPTTNHFSNFRYASLAAGLYPTSNYMAFAGSVQVWKVDLELADSYVVMTDTSAVTTHAMSRRVIGLAGVTTLPPRDNYSESFIKGAYTVATDKSGKFCWNNFSVETTYQDVKYGETPETPALVWDGTHNLIGMGNVEAIVIKISSPTGAVNSALLRVWNCLEATPNTNSSLFQFSGLSPRHDPLALAMYTGYKNQLPVAVPAVMNAGSWQKVFEWLKTAFGVGSLLPGPAGQASMGLGMVTNAFEQMFLV